MNWLEAAATDGDTYLYETVHLLWPPPLGLATTRRAAGGGHVRSYVLVPSARRAKVLLPARPRWAAAAALRGFKTTQSRREACVLAVLAATTRLGGDVVLRDRLYVSVPPGSAVEDFESYLTATLDRCVLMSLHISRPRAVRKPVLQLIDDAGRTFAFSKLGVNGFTNALVRAESRTVQRLGGAAWRVLRVPRLLHTGTWREHPVLVLEALPRSGGTGNPALVAAAMDELARVDGTETGSLAHAPFFRRLLDDARRLPPNPLRETIVASLGDLGRTSTGVTVEFGAWHGDWTPWNMNVRSGRVQVWDWEKFETGVPVGFDAAHCFVQQAVVREHRPPADVFAELLRSAEPVRAAHRSTTQAAQLACWAYAVSLAVGYLRDGEVGLGASPLTRLDGWLPETLHRAAAAVQNERAARGAPGGCRRGRIPRRRSEGGP